jgi:hypothetical protein
MRCGHWLSHIPAYTAKALSNERNFLPRTWPSEMEMEKQIVRIQLRQSFARADGGTVTKSRVIQFADPLVSSEGAYRRPFGNT